LKILVTGASGLLGSSIINQATRRGHDVCSTYHTHNPAIPTSAPIDLTRKDLVEKLILKEKPETVVHTAALTDVDLCEQDPRAAMQVNDLATGNLSRSCHQMGIFLIYVSTDYVFDGKTGKYSESDTPNPINVYGASKLAGEQQVATHCNQFCIARTSVLYGWARLHRPNFATWLYRSLQQGQKISVVADQFASVTLNTQLSRMIIEVAERRSQGTIHLAGNERVSRYDFALRVAEKFRFDTRLIEPIQGSSSKWIAKRPRDSSLNVSKALTELNNKPSNIEAALNEFAADKTDEVAIKSGRDRV
jgi:dTDP-4-dehydrorhamnose reductase